jgi:hypothetical protein
MGRKKGSGTERQHHRVFMSVCAQYRESMANYSGLRAGGSGSSIDNNRPTFRDFRADVELALRASLKSNTPMWKFRAACLTYEFHDEPEQLRFASLILGHNSLLSVIQRVGGEFRRRGLHKGYFTSIRRRIGDSSPVANAELSLADLADEKKRRAKAARLAAQAAVEPVAETNRFAVWETNRFQDHDVVDDPFATQENEVQFEVSGEPIEQSDDSDGSGDHAAALQISS